jgi:hypothetical protein
MKHTERRAALKHATTPETRSTAYTAALSCKGPVRRRWAIPRHGGRPVATTLIAGLLVAGAGLPIRASEQQLTGYVRLLDVLRIRADKPARSAVLKLKLPLSPKDLSCDVLVAGASTGGVAAALAVVKGGHTACLTEETKWIGGQMTAQGVSAFDGNRYIETTAPTASFAELARGIRNYYKQYDQLSALGASEKYFNPGNCWVSSLCFQAPAALEVLNSMLEPYELKGLLRIFLRTKVVKVERQGREITCVLAYAFTTRQWTNFKARYVLDATDTGELLPLAGAEYITGAEPRSLTGEPHARAGHGDLNDDQSFTYTFVLTLDPSHDHRIPKPAEYEAHRLDQPYTLNIDYGHGKILTYRMFQKAAGTPGSFWDYRRLIAADNFEGPRAPPEQSMVNWPGNDYCDSNLLSNDPLKQAQALREAKLVALGFVYWLQTNAPHDDGRGTGYPAFELLRSALGTEDGLSQFPYVRESRRIRALKTVMEQEISSPYQEELRAARFEDSVGIGLYPIDIHSCSKSGLHVRNETVPDPPQRSDLR